MSHAMHHPRWALFYDFHTMPACPDVGEKFDVETFIDHVKACGVDYIVFPARCNLGMAYYDTAVGIRHPSLKYDLLGRLVDACQSRSVAIAAYINVGLSHEEGLRHRNWLTVSPEGHAYRPDRLDHFFREMCYNSDYGNHVVEMVKEVVSGYSLSGLMLDCMNVGPCVGMECVQEMKEREIDWRDPEALSAFARSSWLKMARRIATAAKSIRNDLLLYFNGIPFEDQQDIGTYLEFECLPTGGWGYETLPVYARYIRNLGKPLLNQTGRFHKSWGDFGGIRTEASLEYDCLYGLANAMGVMIGDHLHPRGDMNHAVLDLVERIYGRLQKLEPWVENAVALTEIGIVAPHPALRKGTGFAPPSEMEVVKGAARIFCELKAQFDVLSATMAWKDMKVIVLPDCVSMSEEMAEKIRIHLEGGGAILSSGWSGLDAERRAFVAGYWGLAYEGESPHDPAYFTVSPPWNDVIPDMPHNFYGPGISMRALPGTDVLARVVAPYYNRHWDGEHGFLYLPPDRVTEQSAVTLCGSVAHISHAVFRSYYSGAPIPLRQVVGKLMDLLVPKPMVRVPGFPSFGRVTVTAQTGRRMVHLLAYVPERRGTTIDMIEEPIELHEVSVSLRADGPDPKQVYLAPSRTLLPFEVKQGYITVTIPAMSGYAMVVFEQ